MAKLYFYYAAMNAGKSTMLLQANHNYLERGMSTLMFTPEKDTRLAKGKVHSRLGISFDAYPFGEAFDFYAYLTEYVAKKKKPHCVLLDEAQFLSVDQVRQLVRIVDLLHIPVLTYGLRTDFQGNLFPGSEKLLAWADELKEVKTMCHCGRKAIMNLRVDASGKKVADGPQVLIGGNTLYIAVCRHHFEKGESGPPSAI